MASELDSICCSVAAAAARTTDHKLQKCTICLNVYQINVAIARHDARKPSSLDTRLFTKFTWLRGPRALPHKVYSTVDFYTLQAEKPAGGVLTVLAGHLRALVVLYVLRRLCPQPYVSSTLGFLHPVCPTP